MKVRCCHNGAPVQVGPYEIYAGGTQYFSSVDDFQGYDLIVPLTNGVPFGFKFGVRYEILAGPLVDYGGVPENWREFLESVIGELKAGKCILTFCVGSHGRTGCMLGSLIALLETKEQTPDPIAAVRERHCSHAVETFEQAAAIFALRGEAVPQCYAEEFQSKAKGAK